MKPSSNSARDNAPAEPRHLRHNKHELTWIKLD